MKGERKNTYQEVESMQAVLVKVPNQSDYMRFVKEHAMEGNIKVSAHWRNGLLIEPKEPKLILNRNFYGISANDFGEKIVATVKVVKKTTKDGKSYTMLDIIKEKSTGIYDMRFVNGCEEGLPILHSGKKILFRMLKRPIVLK